MGNVTIETEIKCPKCKKMINRDRAAKNKYVCYECGYYFRVKTHNRIRMVADRKSFQPWFEEIEESNPLKYEGYEEKLSEAREKSGVKEAVTVGECEIYGEKAVIALKLKEVFGLDDINELPIIYNIAWYEQKAVIVLLSLLYLGVKNIHLGPTLPAFLSPNVAKVLMENFGIAGIDTVENDMKLFFEK